MADMKHSTINLLVTLLLFVEIGHAEEVEDTNEYVLVKRRGEYCLVTQMSGHEVPWCDTQTMKPPMRERLELAKKKEADRFERVMQPNPLTPKFNACVAHVRETGEFMYVNHGCRSPLFQDVRALEGFFSKGERALEAQRSGEI